MSRKLKPYLSREQIAAAVSRLAGELDQAYSQRPPVAVGVLKGGFIFLADLVRQMKTPLRSIELVQVSSYGAGTVSSGRAYISRGAPRQAVRGQDVVLVEDIIDTGITTSLVLAYLRRSQPASVAVCALLDKPARRRVAVTPRFVGFTIPDKFVVGYGLDLNQEYRQLPDLYTVEE